MRFTLLAAAALGLLFSSCGEEQLSQEEMLTNKWQAVKIENPQLAGLIKSQQGFIDTFGKKNSAEQNIAIYGFSNVDSLRAVLQSQLDSFVKIQQSTIDKTVFTFREDHIAMLQFEAYADSAKWEYDSTAHMLVLDDRSMKPEGERTQMEVMSLTKDSLKLKYVEQGDTSVAIFKSIKK